MTSLNFTEEMKGFVTFAQTSFEDGYAQGQASNTALMFHLTITADDLDRFIQEPEHKADAQGWVGCEQLGGRRPVERGVFQLFTDSANLHSKKMYYRLFFRDANGQPFTLSGFKQVETHVAPNIWGATTTLYTNLYPGHIEADQEPTTTVTAVGILRILPQDFLKQLTTIRAHAPTLAERVAGVERFGVFFFAGLWEAYRPTLLPSMDPFEREIALYSTAGVSGATIETHAVQTPDKLGLSLQRFLREPCDDVVVLMHGLTTSTDMFIMPEHVNLAQYLLDRGFTDVWSFDFRMSNRFSYNLRRHRYTMDDVALYDCPSALNVIRAAVGAKRRIHVICHCLGSVSFMMSLFAKKATGVKSVISNSVSLTPRVPFWSKCKLIFGPPLVEYFLGAEYVNPYWRRDPGLSWGKVLSWFVSLLHRECSVPECHMLSFMWGTGFPALYRHENLHDVTHRRGGDLYGGTSMNYYRHVRRMVFSGNTAVKYDRRNPKHESLPDNYLQYAAEIETPVLFVTGQQNNVFRDSNIVCHERLEKIVPGRHQLHVFPGYGHQDVFMGSNVHVDIFPRFLEFLESQRTS